MAFVILTKRGGFELRESQNTPKGPRSRTLATFKELTDDVIEKARARASKPLSAEEVRRAAQRAGVPGARDPIDRAARELIAELGKGRPLDPTLRQLLVNLLGQREGEETATPATSDAARAVAEWMASTPRERGNALFDLLLLADALPHGGRVGKPLEYPRLDSSSANA
ncbi:MAG: hypothetical protein ACHQCF_07705 [Solirubrobacterales bacterium]